MKWFEKNPRFFEREKKSLHEFYPLLIPGVSAGSAMARGTLHFCAIYKDSELSDRYLVTITFSDDYPEDYPRVKEEGGRIDRSYHTMRDNSLCLETPLNQMIIFSRDPTIIGFINNLVVPYLYRHSFREKYHTDPYPDRQHGIKGIMEQYFEMFGVCDVNIINRLLSVVTSGSYKGHSPCPCESGKILDQCHGPRLLDLKRRSGKYLARESNRMMLYAMNQLKDESAKDREVSKIIQNLEITEMHLNLLLEHIVESVIKDMRCLHLYSPNRWEHKFKQLLYSQGTNRKKD